MRSYVFSLAALCFAANVSAQEWFAVFTDNNGFAFMDSNNARSKPHQLHPNIVASVDEVNANKDKGEHFRFPTGSGGTVVSQAHSDHAVGYDPSANEFHAEFSTSHLDALVNVTINGYKASFCNNNNYIGVNGQNTNEPFEWTIQ